MCTNHENISWRTFTQQIHYTQVDQESQYFWATSLPSFPGATFFSTVTVLAFGSFRVSLNFTLIDPYSMCPSRSSLAPHYVCIHRVYGNNYLSYSLNEYRTAQLAIYSLTLHFQFLSVVYAAAVMNIPYVRIHFIRFVYFYFVCI